MQLIQRRAAPVALATCLLLVSPSGWATENQSVRALLGAPGQEMTMPQLPGVYGQLWTQQYSATQFRDARGHDQSAAVGNGVSAVRGGSIEALAIVPRLTFISEDRLGDGRMGLSVTLPYISLDANTRLTARFPSGTPAQVQAAVKAQLAAKGQALSDHVDGLGDMEIAPFLDYQDDESRLVLLAALVAPTGDYRLTRSVNTGSGKFWTFRPGFLYGLALDSGLELGTRVTYSINQQNNETGVRSGQYLHMDYSLMYRMADTWRVGLQGYLLQQTTRDKGPGVAADGNKAEIFAAGPSLGYSSEDGQWGAELKVLPEWRVRNRPQGTTSWLRLMFRLD
jgi:hypothetical protein